MLVSLYMYINSVLVEKIFNAVRADNWDPDTDLHRRCTDTRIMVISTISLLCCHKYIILTRFPYRTCGANVCVNVARDRWICAIDRAIERSLVRVLSTNCDDVHYTIQHCWDLLHWLLPIDSAVGRRRKSVCATIDRTRGGANERSSENAADNNNTR